MKKICFLVLLLSGCAPLQTSFPPSPTIHALWQTHQTHLTALKNWRLNGTISITREEENWRARVYWQQQDSYYQLRFNAPMGQGALLLEGNDNQVVMRTANNETFVARDPETLVAKVLKLELPVSHLYFWIRGLPNPNLYTHQLKFKKTGYLHALQQAGWEIEYGEYLKFNENEIELPKQIFLNNNQFQVKMVISPWNIES